MRLTQVKVHQELYGAVNVPSVVLKRTLGLTSC